MEVREKKEVKTFQSVITGIKCDVCKKIEHVNQTPEDWHLIVEQHEEWGNDSVESVHYHHVCSSECYATKFKEIVIKFKPRRWAEVDGMQIQFARKLAEKL
jgi:hypothetical protein